MGFFKKREEFRTRSAAAERRQAFSQMLTNYRVAGAAGGNYDDNQQLFDAVVRHVRNEQALNQRNAGIGIMPVYYDITNAAEAFRSFARGYNPSTLWVDCLGLLWELRSEYGDQVPDPVAEHTEDIVQRRPRPSTPSGRAFLQACGLETPDELPESEQETLLRDLIQRIEAGEEPSGDDLRTLDKLSPDRRAIYKQTVDRFLGLYPYS